MREGKHAEASQGSQYTLYFYTIYSYYWPAGIPRTTQDGQARIFGKTRIRLRKLAEQEHRAAFGNNTPRVNAIRTETQLREIAGFYRFISHASALLPRIS